MIRRQPLWRRALPLLVWLGCLAVAVSLLQALGDGRLAAPPLTDPASWTAWVAARDPLEVVMVVLRLVALAVAWYLTGVTSVAVIARLLRAARLVRIADALSVGPVRVLVQQALGVGLAAGVVATSVPGIATPGRAAASDSRADVAVMAIVEADDRVEVRGEVRPTAGVPAEVMIPVPAPAVAVPRDASASPPPAPASEPAAPSASPASRAPQPEVAPPDPAPPAEAPPPAPAARAAAREVRVAPGDHFWGLAEQAVGDHLGRPGSEDEVVAHWEAMLAANADRLLVAGNPDLLLPGQLVRVPDVAEVLS